MARELSNLRLGDLLTDAGLLKFEELQEAVHIAKNQSLPVGRVLIMSGYLSERVLQCAIKVQSLVKDAILDYELGLKALAILQTEPIELDDALQRLGWSKQEGMRTNKLGELLLTAGIINTMQLDLALAQSEHSGLPLGRVLVNFSLISEQLLASALSAQLLVRDKKITREQAIQGLVAARDRAVPLEETLPEAGHLKLPSKPSVRLGQLLVVAGLVDEAKLMQAVELGLVQEKPLGKMLLSLNVVSEQVLSKALEAQALVATGIDLDQAANILTTAVNKDITIGQATSLLMGSQKANRAESEGPQLPLYQFLQLSGMITKKDIEQAIRAGTEDPEIMGKMLLKAGVLEDYIVDAAVACCGLISRHVLQTEQAIMALNHCRRTRSSIYDCFDEFGWSQPPEAEMRDTNPGLPKPVTGIAATIERRAQAVDRKKQEEAPPEQSVFEVLQQQADASSEETDSETPADAEAHADLNEEHEPGNETTAPEAETETETETKGEVEGEAEAKAESEADGEPDADSDDEDKPKKPKKKLIDLVP